MNEEPPSRLELLRFARRVVVRQAKAALAQIDRWIAVEETREAERRQGLEARPPAPEWLLERGLSGHDPVYVHVGDCWNAGKRSRGLERDEARRALADGVKPCPQCRPDSALGFLD
ncbi:DUF6233 domain-containing protein [Streptomyces sp. NPDC055952]|uniref:DUF6233 domain-containing protein n=1 Tax=Streptomyces sp. NPDC055952 TaxID=3345663 RepID=UPI0035DBC779